MALLGCGGDDGSSAGAGGVDDHGPSGGAAGQGAQPDAGLETRVRLDHHPEPWDPNSAGPIAEGDQIAWRWLDEETTGLALRIRWSDPEATAGPHRVRIRLSPAGSGEPAFDARHAEFAAEVTFESNDDGPAPTSPWLDVPLGPPPAAGAGLIATVSIDDGPESGPLRFRVYDAYPADPCRSFAPTLGTVGGCVEAVVAMSGFSSHVIPSGETRACGELGLIIGWLETASETAGRCLRSRGFVEWANAVRVETEASGQCLADAGYAYFGDEPPIDVETRFAVDGRGCPERRFVLLSDVGDCACAE
jgi:hypothetical protein